MSIPIYQIHPVLIAAAVIPAAILLFRVEKADRLEKESLGLLLSLVFFGIISTAVAGILERIGITILDSIFDEAGILYNAVLFFGVVAFAEEGAKYVLLKRRTWNHPEFNCQFDGVVYSVFVALGFALWENISYVAMFGLSVALIRAVTAVPGHACFGVFMGVWYGAAKRFETEGDLEGSKRTRRLALLIPAALHGLYDFIASLSGEYMSLIFIAFVVVLFIAAKRLIRKASANDVYFRRTPPGSGIDNYPQN